MSAQWWLSLGGCSAAGAKQNEAPQSLGPGDAPILFMADGWPGSYPCGRDSPAPSSSLRLGPQTVVGGLYRKRLQADKGWSARNRSAADTPLRLRRKQEGEDVGRATHTKTDVVVTVVRVDVVAEGRARVVLVVVIGAAAHNPAVGPREPRRPKTSIRSLPQKSLNFSKKIAYGALRAPPCR